MSWFVRWYFSRGYTSVSRFASSGRMLISVEVTETTVPARRAMTTTPESYAVRPSIPVPTRGGSGEMRGTAWRCMFEPMRALLASSCSRKGMSEADTEMICLGETSMYWMSSGGRAM